MQELGIKELEDILKGCTILGTGGGGSFERGFETVRKDFDNGKYFRLIKLDEVPNEALVACPYHCGAIQPIEAETEAGYSRRIENSSPLVAFRALERYMGKTFFAALSTELGGGNTATALSVAANQDIPIVDADPAGRSVPELVHTTFFVKGIPITPMAVATDFGDVVIIPQVADDYRAEALARTIAVASGGHAGVVDHPITGARLRTAVIPGAISYAETLGKALREARASGANVVEAITKAGKGFILFEGTIKDDCVFEIKEGFTYGDIIITGKGAFEGQTGNIWFKNENIMAWINGEVAITAPDLICVLESKTGEPITNPNCKYGMDVSMVGFPAPEQWRTAKGLEVLGPRYFGFDVDYTPIENRMT